MVSASSSAATQLTASPMSSDRAERQHDAEPECLAGQHTAGRQGPAGRARITASMSRSYHMLIAPDAPAPTAMHRTAITASTGCKWPGARNEPDKAP